MLIFDQLRKNDPQLRLLALVMCAGLFVLLAGLWWVQIVSARNYQGRLETQSYRTVRLPAVRGKILDRNGRVLAENRPNYSISLYFEDMRRAFDRAYAEEVTRVRAEREQQMAARESRLGRKLNQDERRGFAVTLAERNEIRAATRYATASNLVWQIGVCLQRPLMLDRTHFARHYETRRALPYPVLANLDAGLIARFEEQFAGTAAVDLEVQSARHYPFGSTAAHVLGYLRFDDQSAVGEDAYFSYRLPDYRGVVGIEGYFDRQLRGQAGAKSVLVNNLGYRQSEEVWSVPISGHNVVLTLDLRVQQAAELALRHRVGSQVRGAVVVMEVQTGDLLALVSAPAFDPNRFLPQISREEYAALADPVLRPQINRATQENYAPGSIFKTVVGLAALQAGLNPHKEIYNPGHIYVGRRYINDLAPPGDYNFRRALLKSSNTYFITNGLLTGIQPIIELGERFRLGERAGLPTWQETAGSFPSARRLHAGWSAGDTANICIGQGEMAVTPLQMAVMTAAIANGGKVLWPRLVERIEPPQPASETPPEIFPSRRLRNELGLRAEHLKTVRDAMLADTEDFEGTGRAAVVPGLRIGGKTGTAQIMDARNRVVDQTTWFISFAPYENPRYAVVVMVESGSSGGSTCAPVAHDIYSAMLKMDPTLQSPTLAQSD